MAKIPLNMDREKILQRMALTIRGEGGNVLRTSCHYTTARAVSSLLQQGQGQGQKKLKDYEIALLGNNGLVFHSILLHNNDISTDSLRNAGLSTIFDQSAKGREYSIPDKDLPDLQLIVKINVADFLARYVNKKSPPVPEAPLP